MPDIAPVAAQLKVPIDVDGHACNRHRAVFSALNYNTDSSTFLSHLRSLVA